MSELRLSEPHPPQPRSPVVQSSLFVLKIGLLGLMWLGLLLPLLRVRALVEERQQYQQSVIQEVGANWGGAQTVAGPVLSVPVRQTETFTEVVDGIRQERSRSTVRWHHFLPEELRIDGDVAPSRRHRGIFETVVYRADLQVEGHFAQPTFTFDDPTVEYQVLWQEARLSLGIADLRGLRSKLDLRFAGRDAQLTPGTDDPAGWHLSILGAPVTLAASGQSRYEFALALGVNGSGSIRFLPAGRQTTVELASTWPDPSFGGAFLPDDRTLGPTGFKASWQVPFFARDFPQRWSTSQIPADMLGSTFGVDLMVPVDAYTKTDRALKYAGLFILFTFMAFLLFEIFEGRPLHVVQYLLVGFAMSIFYLLLLSFAEHVGFTNAYLVAATAVTLLIAGYSRAILGSRTGSLVLGAVLAVLYAFLFVLLKSQDYALLVGSIALFLVLAGVMYVTRHLRWSSAKPAPAESDEVPPPPPDDAIGRS